MVIVNEKPFEDATDTTAVTVISVMHRPVVVEFSNGANVSWEAPMTGTIWGGDRLANVTAVDTDDEISGV